MPWRAFQTTGPIIADGRRSVAIAGSSGHFLAASLNDRLSADSPEKGSAMKVRMMKLSETASVSRIVRSAVTAGGLALLSGLAFGQSISGGALSGKVFSAGATVPNRSQAFVTTTPSDSWLVITQICTSHPNALRFNAGPIVGDIPLNTAGKCTQYFPGIAVPPKTNINCFDNAGAAGQLRCMLTGVLTAP